MVIAFSLALTISNAQKDILANFAERESWNEFMHARWPGRPAPSDYWVQWEKNVMIGKHGRRFSLFEPSSAAKTFSIYVSKSVLNSHFNFLEVITPKNASFSCGRNIYVRLKFIWQCESTLWVGILVYLGSLYTPLSLKISSTLVSLEGFLASFWFHNLKTANFSKRNFSKFL